MHKVDITASTAIKIGLKTPLPIKHLIKKVNIYSKLIPTGQLGYGTPASVCS